jgi:hypothetical protein
LTFDEGNQQNVAVRGVNGFGTDDFFDRIIGALNEQVRLERGDRLRWRIFVEDHHHIG